MLLLQVRASLVICTPLIKNLMDSYLPKECSDSKCLTPEIEHSSIGFKTITQKVAAYSI